MKKIIRLTESDLTRLVERVIKEQADNDKFAKVAEKVVDNDNFEKRMEELVSKLPKKHIEQLNNFLDSMGIEKWSTPEEVHAKIEDAVEDVEQKDEMVKTDDEITEAEEVSSKDDLKMKIADVLHNIGAGNIAAWGGVPAAILIGFSTGMPVGFAASWGATILLMGLAKALGKKD
jgi:hypothetical protein